MNQWYAVINSTTGALVSTGTSVAPDAELSAAGLEKVLIPENPQDRSKKWNATTRTFEVVFVPRPALTSSQILSLFTDSEFVSLVDSASNHPDIETRKRVAGFIEKLKLMGGCSLDDPWFTDSVTWFESAALITTGRAVEILT